VDGASEREGGRENEAGRWKVSENVQEFQDKMTKFSCDVCVVYSLLVDKLNQ